MNFAIPRKNDSELLLYIWKIIDLPFISQNDLIYRISFDLFIFSPNEAKKFINNCIEKKILRKTDNMHLELSTELYQEFNNWQKKRKNEILKNFKTKKTIDQLKKEITKKDSNNFGVLLNAFADKGTLNRSVSVSDAAFELFEYNQAKGIVKAKVKGSIEEFYEIDIDTNERILRHNCFDFMERRVESKQFCKHITKLFLLLKDRNEKIAEFFLNELAKNIDNWDFTS
jgi:hypothetical protein